MRQLTATDFPAYLDRLAGAYQSSYLAMYSSVYEGIVTDPRLMLLPIDDHMVHRGDGVFEAMKCVDGAIYNLDAHLDRLDRSAGGTGLALPVSREQLVAVLRSTVQAGGERDAVVRLFVSRGPGSFGVNPYETIGSQLYVVVTRKAVPFMEKHPDGATLKTSSVPVKAPQFAEIKNCNYLPNVLMSKEARDHDVDFVAGFDERGLLTEGATENIGVITRDAELLFPKVHGLLRGTTMIRLAELASALRDTGELKAIDFRDIAREDILQAAEVLIVGTTRDVTSVREYDGCPVGDGRPGPLAPKLNTLLQDDMRSNSAMRTEMFEGQAE